MNTKELKALSGEKTKNMALATIYARLERRKWIIQGKEYNIAGLDSKTLEVHFTRTKSLDPGSCWHNRIKVELKDCIDCVSGFLS